MTAMTSAIPCGTPNCQCGKYGMRCPVCRTSITLHGPEMTWIRGSYFMNGMHLPTTPEIFSYMVFRAEKEGQAFEFDEGWFKDHLVSGVRGFFGVEVDSTGDILKDEKNPIWFAEFKSLQ